MVFPALFTAGMTLVDTTDSILMLDTYGWAFVKPIRKLYYNLTITAVSVVVAVIVGGLETLNLIGDQLGLTDGGDFWGAVGSLNDNFGVLGFVIVGIFIAAWLVSYVVYRVNRYDENSGIERVSVFANLERHSDPRGRLHGRNGLGLTERDSAFGSRCG
jgi:high-affinity nickel-transport protein